MQVKSTVKLNMARINELSQAAVRALEQTAEELHTEVVQAQVMPFDTVIWKKMQPLWMIAIHPVVRCRWFLPHHMLDGFIIIQNIDSRRVKIRTQKENGWMIGCRVEVKQTLPRMHLRDFTRRRVVCDAEDHRHP